MLWTSLSNWPTPFGEILEGERIRRLALVRALHGFIAAVFMALKHAIARRSGDDECSIF